VSDGSVKIFFDSGKENAFIYKGQIIFEDTFFLTIKDKKRGLIKLAKSKILRQEPLTEEGSQ